jgi:lipopolysaccharide/colanic/teichoic acid biosynthesis glycosyltransferase
LDELPELWNVVKGDMSMVGPRPLLMEYLSRYSERQARRHEVPPGITGWAQVNGRNTLPWPERLEMDVWYVENRTLMLDLKILWLTIRKVLKREGISQPGRATQEAFMGNGDSHNAIRR